jgi:parallel beta-helix repeat protein
LPTNNFLLISGSNVDLGYFAVTGRDTGRFIAVNDVSNVHIHDLYVSGTSSLPTNGPMAGIYAVGSDIWIDNNILSGNGPATNPPDLQSYDIVAWRNPSRIHIRNNQISNSNAGQSIACFNCQHSDAIGNEVDQNNRMPSPIIGGGYGIVFYASTGIIEAARIEHNNVTNTAGSGIYCANCSHTSIANNTVTHVARQQSDDVEPVGCVSVNGFDHGSVAGNVCDGSVKDCFVIDTGGAGSTGVSGSVFSGNTAHFCGGNGFSFRSTIPLTNLVVTGNSVELVNGTNGYAFNIYLVSLVQSLILTNNIVVAPPGRSYNLGDRCLNCLVADNM